MTEKRGRGRPRLDIHGRDKTMLKVYLQPAIDYRIRELAKKRRVSISSLIRDLIIDETQRAIRAREL
jgi:hypothetical protein